MTAPPRPIDDVIALLRNEPVDLAADIPSVRARFAALGGAPPPAVIDPLRRALGGVPVLDLPGHRAGTAPIVFAHSGGYVAGSAAQSFDLASRLREATGRRVVSVDYRLAPEHPFPAARDDLIAVLAALTEEGAPRPAVVGASAGGGVALHALMHVRDQGGPLPAAVALLSPFTDLTLSGESCTRNARRDPSVTAAGLRACAGHYGAPEPGALRPAPGNLFGLPPMQVHAGSIEILLSDAIDLTAAAAQADVHVELLVWPDMVHVFPTFAARLVEGRRALERIGTFLDAEMPA